MKEKEVYVVIINDVYESVHSTEVKLFENKEDALNELENQKLTAVDYESNDYTYEETEMGFEYYLDGYSSQDSFSVNIVKRVVL